MKPVKQEDKVRFHFGQRYGNNDLLGERLVEPEVRSKIKWPKTPKPLSDEQKQNKKDFLRLWHEILPQKYGRLEQFNHGSKILRDTGLKKNIKTLEIGAGLGEHINYENLEHQDYTALEVRDDFVATIKSRFPQVHAFVGDIQSNTGLPTASFDRVLAIHVLEHLPDLPAALHEIKRLMKPDGSFIVVIPCEGGLAYSLARYISAQRIFEAKYRMPYKPIIENEHVNKAWEIRHELNSLFDVEQTSYWPLHIPVTEMNLVIALLCKIKKTLK